MGYLNENGLARYDGLIKNWVTFKSGTVDGIDPLLNWQKTEAASSVTFYPLPAAPIDPVVNFAFTETPPTEGDKSPSNPSTITGVSSITVTRCETEGVDETDYTVNLGGTYYGGSVDLSTGVMTVTHTMYDIGASMANYSESNEVFYFDVPKTVLSTLPTCESFVYHATTGVLADLPDGQFMPHVAPDPSTQTRWIFRASSYSSVLDFQAAFSGKKLVYQLATLQTVQVTPTQIYSLSQSDPYTPRINTVYSDQQSVQVGYPKSPQASQTELTNAIVSLGGNV